jgi:pre-mRNA-splicing factor CWC26
MTYTTRSAILPFELRELVFCKRLYTRRQLMKILTANCPLICTTAEPRALGFGSGILLPQSSDVPETGCPMLQASTTGLFTNGHVIFPRLRDLYRNMASLSKQAYLAAKYMSGPKADAILANTSKSNSSRKRKPRSPQPSSNSAFVLQDNDAPWSSTRVSQNDDDNEQPMPLADSTFISDRSFKNRRRDADGSGWETIRAPTPPPPDEQPLVVEPETPRITGGILGKTELTRLRAKRETSSVPDQMDTVYRDASGRKIDTKAEKAAAARQKRLQEEKEAQKMEWGKGLVQREEDEQMRQQLELQRAKDISRCVQFLSREHIGNVFIPVETDMQMMLISTRCKRSKTDGTTPPQPSFL